MKINVNRLCELAGLNHNSGGLLNEASNRSMHDDPGLAGEAEYRYGKGQINEDLESDTPAKPNKETLDALEEMGDMSEKDEDLEEMYASMDEKDDDQIVEIDEVTLVQELRRAKRIMMESRKRNTVAQRKSIAEQRQLKKIIEEEVENVIQELNLNSQWVYGNRRPRNSRSGYTAQGSYIPGIGFKK